MCGFVMWALPFTKYNSRRRTTSWPCYPFFLSGRVGSVLICHWNDPVRIIHLTMSWCSYAWVSLGLVPWAGMWVRVSVRWIHRQAKSPQCSMGPPDPIVPVIMNLLSASLILPQATPHFLYPIQNYVYGYYVFKCMRVFVCVWWSHIGGLSLSAVQRSRAPSSPGSRGHVTKTR